MSRVKEGETAPRRKVFEHDCNSKGTIKKQKREVSDLTRNTEFLSRWPHCKEVSAELSIVKSLRNLEESGQGSPCTLSPCQHRLCVFTHWPPGHRAASQKVPGLWFLLPPPCETEGPFQRLLSHKLEFHCKPILRPNEANGNEITFIYWEEIGTGLSYPD